MPIFIGNPPRAVAIDEYNALLKNPEFYRYLPAEHCLFTQTDAYLRKHIPEKMLEYDFLAGPIAWDTSSAGGGLSFRRRSAMIELCTKYKGTESGEDVYISNGVKALGLKRPEFMEAITYIAESCLYEDPVGVHQWWTYFYTELEDADIILKNLLVLEI